MRIFAPSVLILCFALAGCGTASTSTPSSTKTAATPATTTTAPAPSPAPATKPKVFFVAPKDGDEVASPVHVVMGVEGMKVMPAGDVVEGTGHFHIIIDGGPVPEGKVVPTDATHIHYGKGQTETDLKLSKGEHTLTLQFANGKHESYGPDLAATIHVKVTGEASTASAK